MEKPRVPSISKLTASVESITPKVQHVYKRIAKPAITPRAKELSKPKVVVDQRYRSQTRQTDNKVRSSSRVSGTNVSYQSNMSAIKKNIMRFKYPEKKIEPFE